MAQSELLHLSGMLKETEAGLASIGIFQKSLRGRDELDVFASGNLWDSNELNFCHFFGV